MRLGNASEREAYITVQGMRLCLAEDDYRITGSDRLSNQDTTRPGVAGVSRTVWEISDIIALLDRTDPSQT